EVGGRVARGAADDVGMVQLRIECRRRPRLAEDTRGFERRTGDAEGVCGGTPYAGRNRTLVAAPARVVRVGEAWPERKSARLAEDIICATGRAPHTGGRVRFTAPAVIELRPAAHAGG